MKIKTNIFVNRFIQILLLFLFVINVGSGLFAPIFAVFVTKSILGATLKTVGFAVAISAIVKSILQIPIARRIDKKSGERDDFYVMLSGAVLGAIYLFGLIFVRSVSMLYFLSAIDGVAGACLMAAYYSMFSRHADKGAEGFEWSLFSVGGLTISSAIGGAIGGIIADSLGFKSTLFIGGVLYLTSAILLIFLYPLLDGVHRSKNPSPSLPQVPLP